MLRMYIILLHCLAVSLACFMSGTLYCCQCPTGLQCSTNAICELPKTEAVLSDFEISLLSNNSENEPSGFTTVLAIIGGCAISILCIYILYIYIVNRINSLCVRIVSYADDVFHLAGRSVHSDLASNNIEMQPCHSLEEVVVL